MTAQALCCPAATLEKLPAGFTMFEVSPQQLTALVLLMMPQQVPVEHAIEVNNPEGDGIEESPTQVTAELVEM